MAQAKHICGQGPALVCGQPTTEGEVRLHQHKAASYAASFPCRPFPLLLPCPSVQRVV